MLIHLRKVTVNKYKSILKKQEVEIDPAITTVVGMKESGKTNFLEVIAKTNYFNDDKDYKFDTTQDFPRNELIDFQSSDTTVEIVSCHYEISEALLALIDEGVGKGVFNTKTFVEIKYYDKTPTVSGINANQKKYLEHKLEGGYTLSKETKAAIKKLSTLKEVEGVKTSM